MCTFSPHITKTTKSRRMRCGRHVTAWGMKNVQAYTSLLFLLCDKVKKSDVDDIW